MFHILAPKLYKTVFIKLEYNNSIEIDRKKSKNKTTEISINLTPKWQANFWKVQKKNNDYSCFLWLCL